MLSSLTKQAALHLSQAEKRLHALHIISALVAMQLWRYHRVTLARMPSHSARLRSNRDDMAVLLSCYALRPRFPSLFVARGRAYPGGPIMHPSQDNNENQLSLTNSDS